MTFSHTEHKRSLIMKAKRNYPARSHIALDTQFILNWWPLKVDVTDNSNIILCTQPLTISIALYYYIPLLKTDMFFITDSNLSRYRPLKNILHWNR